MPQKDPEKRREYLAGWRAKNKEKLQAARKRYSEEQSETDSIIVFVDNDSQRAALQFQRMTPVDQSRTFWVKTVPEALDMLENYRERLDVVSMEYDLNDLEYNHPSREDCGLELVRWLERRSSDSYSHVRFIIHTWNSSAGMKMANRLRAHGYNVILKPFGS